jgi:hypothetical protein
MRIVLRALAILSLVACAAVSAAVLNYSLDAVMNGILAVETGGNAFAINDNTTRRSYKFSTKAEAVKMANMLLGIDHNIDMGKFQINSIHLSRGWSVEKLFDETFNRSAAETIFNEWLAAAKKLYGDVEWHIREQLPPTIPAVLVFATATRHTSPRFFVLWEF